MGPQNPEDDALNRILGDMDGMEGGRMMGGQDASKGVSITISVTPQGGDADGDSDDYPEGHDMAMCGGGCAYHKGGLAQPTPMAAGGVVPGADVATPEEDSSKLPPFLRKKKKPLQDS